MGFMTVNGVVGLIYGVVAIVAVLLVLIPGVCGSSAAAGPGARALASRIRVRHLRLRRR